MTQAKISGGRQALPTIEQAWTPDMAATTPLCTQPIKRTYDTRGQATDAAKAIRRRGGKRVEPYQCPCGKFHLTKHRRT